MRCSGPCYCTGACRESYDISRPPNYWPGGPVRPMPTVVPHQPVKKIKSIEYHPDGTVKKIEYFEEEHWRPYFPVIR